MDQLLSAFCLHQGYWGDLSFSSSCISLEDGDAVFKFLHALAVVLREKKFLLSIIPFFNYLCFSPFTFCSFSIFSPFQLLSHSLFQCLIEEHCCVCKYRVPYDALFFPDHTELHNSGYPCLFQKELHAPLRLGVGTLFQRIL